MMGLPSKAPAISDNCFIAPSANIVGNVKVRCYSRSLTAHGRRLGKEETPNRTGQNRCHLEYPPGPAIDLESPPCPPSSLLLLAQPPPLLGVVCQAVTRQHEQEQDQPLRVAREVRVLG